MPDDKGYDLCYGGKRYLSITTQEKGGGRVDSYIHAYSSGGATHLHVFEPATGGEPIASFKLDGDHVGQAVLSTDGSGPVAEVSIDPGTETVRLNLSGSTGPLSRTTAKAEPKRQVYELPGDGVRAGTWTVSLYTDQAFQASHLSTGEALRTQDNDPWWIVIERVSDRST